MSRIRSMRRFVAVPVAMAAALLAIAGCSPTQAGAAATIGHERITTSQLDATVNNLRGALNGNDPQGSTAASTVTSVLQIMVNDRLFHIAATKNSIVILPTEVASSRATLESQNGGKANFESSAAKNGIPPTMIDTILESNAILNRLGKQLVPKGTSAQQQVALRLYLTKLSAELNTKVSPRYGTWDSTRLAIVPNSNAVSSAAPSAG